MPVAPRGLCRGMVNILAFEELFISNIYTMIYMCIGVIFGNNNNIMIVSISVYCHNCG